MASLDSMFARVTDADNKPVSGGKLRIYDADTTDLASTFSDAALTVALTNPVVADSAGRLPPVFIAAGTYDMALLTSADVVLDSWNDYTVPDLTGLSSLTNTVVSKSADFSISASDGSKLFEVDASGGDVTVTAEAGTLANGFPVYIANVGATGNVIISADAGEGFNGGSATSYTLETQNEIVGLISRGSSGWRIFTHEGKYPAPDTKTDNYTLALTDVRNPIEMNHASAKVITIPTNASVPFLIGTEIQVHRYGAGTVTLTGDTGVTLNGASAGSVELGDQYDRVTLFKRGTDEWTVRPQFQTTQVDHQTFTGSGTWTKPSVVSASRVLVRMWGAGGGGSSNSQGGGGGGGAYVEKWFLASDLGSTETVTIGAGGSTNSSGGNTTFGAHLTAYGGGAANNATNGGGGGGGGATAKGSDGSGNDGGDGGGGGSSGADGETGNVGSGGDGKVGGGGGGGGNNSTPNAGGDAFWGGAGGGGGGSQTQDNHGGDSVFGGGGGAGAPNTGTATGGNSVHGGNGGDTNSAGSAPGGGGGRNAAGADGRVEVTTYY